MGIQEVCGDKVAEVKEKIEAAVEKVVDENPELLEAAAKVEAAGEVAEEKVEELVEAVKETVEVVKETVDNVSEIVEAEVEAVKADPLYKRIMAALSSFCSVVVARLSAILAPVLNLVSAITDRLATVPWTSLLLPFLLGLLENRLPATCRPMSRSWPPTR